MFGVCALLVCNLSYLKYKLIQNILVRHKQKHTVSYLILTTHVSPAINGDAGGCCLLLPPHLSEQQAPSVQSKKLHMPWALYQMNPALYNLHTVSELTTGYFLLTTDVFAVRDQRTSGVFPSSFRYPFVSLCYAKLHWTNPISPKHSREIVYCSIDKNMLPVGYT